MLLEQVNQLFEEENYEKDAIAIIQKLYEESIFYEEFTSKY